MTVVISNRNCGQYLRSRVGQGLWAQALAARPSKAEAGVAPRGLSWVLQEGTFRRLEGSQRLRPRAEKRAWQVPG